MPPPRTTRRVKRKCSDGEDFDHAVNTPKRKRSQNSKSDEDCTLDVDRGLNLAIAKLNNQLLADYIALQTKRFFPDLSLVELEDKFISGILWEQLLWAAVADARMKAKSSCRDSLP